MKSRSRVTCYSVNNYNLNNQNRNWTIQTLQQILRHYPDTFEWALAFELLLSKCHVVWIADQKERLICQDQALVVFNRHSLTLTLPSFCLWRTECSKPGHCFDLIPQRDSVCGCVSICVLLLISLALPWHRWSGSRLLKSYSWPYIVTSLPSTAVSLWPWSLIGLTKSAWLTSCSKSTGLAGILHGSSIAHDRKSVLRWHMESDMRTDQSIAYWSQQWSCL